MSYDLLYEQALKLHECGSFDEAETLYRQLLEVNPENPDLLNLLGLIGQEKGVHNQAIELFYKAIKISPNHLPYQFNLALSLEHTGKDFEAISYYHKVSIKESFNNIGRIYYSLGKVDAAREHFATAIEMDGDYIEAKANLAMVDSDIEALKKIKDPLACEYLARIYIEQKDLDKALEYALKTTNHELIGTIYTLQNEPDKAKAHLMRVNTAPALINAANIATNEGDFARAEELYKQALELGRSVYDAHLNYGRMLYLAGRNAEALEEYRVAVIANPYAPEASNNLGLILKDTEDFDEALGLFFNAYLMDANESYAVNISETILLYARKEKDKALKIAKNWVRNAKKDVFAINTLKILQGKSVDREYTMRLFDNFAESYEGVLEKINYKVVKELKAILGEVEGTILDLGCGTGLVGEAFKSAKNTLIGVDTSLNMLNKAREKKVYDELVEVDIVEYLSKIDPSRPPLVNTPTRVVSPKSSILGNSSFPNEGMETSLIIAADVFNYIKYLKDIVKAAKGVALAFSIEVGSGVCNGRYKHNPCQVEKLLLKCGYKKIEKHPLVLRIENGKDVEGMIFVAK